MPTFASVDGTLSVRTTGSIDMGSGTAILSRGGRIAVEAGTNLRVYHVESATGDLALKAGGSITEVGPDRSPQVVTRGRLDLQQGAESGLPLRPSAGGCGLGVGPQWIHG
jgi:hypothetical protein